MESFWTLFEVRVLFYTAYTMHLPMYLRVMVLKYFSIYKKKKNLL